MHVSENVLYESPQTKIRAPKATAPPAITSLRPTPPQRTAPLVGCWLFGRLDDPGLAAEFEDPVGDTVCDTAAHCAVRSAAVTPFAVRMHVLHVLSMALKALHAQPTSVALQAFPCWIAVWSAELVHELEHEGVLNPLPPPLVAVFVGATLKDVGVVVLELAPVKLTLLAFTGQAA